jgi:hypothetical protein
VVKPLGSSAPTPWVNQTVLGGQLVMPDSTTGLVKPATAAATTVLGVAWNDANPVGTNPLSPLNTAWDAAQVLKDHADVMTVLAILAWWALRWSRTPPPPDDGAWLDAMWRAPRPATGGRRGAAPPR